jgi:hypothetical protein
MEHLSRTRQLQYQEQRKAEKTELVLYQKVSIGTGQTRNQSMVTGIT